MSKSKHTLFEAVLARMSLGAVPMDGVYWFDPKTMRERAAMFEERDIRNARRREQPAADGRRENVAAPSMD